MKDLLIPALDKAHCMLEIKVPHTKLRTKYLEIHDVKPTDLLSFMKDNGIPDDAWFGGEDNGYDGLSNTCLCWEVEIPTTNVDKLKYRRDNFRDVAYKYVHYALTESGYKRVGFNSGLLKQFHDITIYDMYIRKDFDMLVKYYSLPFVKID